MKPVLLFTKQYMFPFLPWYIFGIVCVMGTQGTMVAIIEEVRAALDAESHLLLSNKKEGIQPLSQTENNHLATDLPSTINPHVYKILLLAALLFVVRILSRYAIFTPGRMIEFRIRNHFFHTLLNKPRAFFRGYETGDLISRASNDIGFIRAAYGYGILQVVNVISTFSIGIWAMWRMDPKTTTLIGLPMFMTLILIQLSIRYLFNHWRRANEQLGMLSSFCLASFQGVSAVKGYHAEPLFIESFTRKSEAYLKTNLLITNVRSFVMPLVQFSGSIATFIVLWVIGARIINGQSSIGEISAYLGYITMVMPPLLSLGWMMNVFNRAVPAIERLHEVLQEDTSTTRLPKELKGPPTLEVRDLGLTFEGTDSGFCMEKLSFDLKPGKKLGIVGEVGSGKTVLVEALLRFNTVQSGTILCNGEQVEHLDLRNYRKWFSFAPQRAFLFSSSLRDNLQLVHDHSEHESSDDELIAALKLAGFSLDPSQFPKGLDTQVGEKGILLSGGQRQRIALARCLLKEAWFYVLDDVLSAVDQETQRDILKNLQSISDEKLFIIVSHRISAVQWCDEILVMENGRIVDRGIHSELVKRPGYYRESFLYQTRGGSSVE